MILSRQLFCTTLALATFIAAAHAQAPAPLLTRVKMATIGAPDVGKIESLYTKYLGLTVREKGKVSAAMAESWGAPKAAGQPFVTMSSDGSPDVAFRAVSTPAVKGYRPMTTWGWNAFEVIVDDIDKLDATLKSSPFKIIGEPHSLGGTFASIKAMQVMGPAGEVLYLTTETGDRQKSNLPIPKAQVDRPFIFILAGSDVGVLRDFYANTFAMKTFPNFDGALLPAAKAMGLPADHAFPLTLVRAAERGNTIELDAYPATAKARPRAAGQLPPGNALASMNVNSLDGLKVSFITAPKALYGPKRAATFVGPAGELMELIEEPRP